MIPEVIANGCDVILFADEPERDMDRVRRALADGRIPAARLEEDGKLATGQSADTDTVVASTRAYVNALNKLLVRRLKTAPEAQSA